MSVREPLVEAWEQVAEPVIGMVHLRALAGSAGYRGELEYVRAAMMRDATALVDGGVDGLLVENFGDVPFYPGKVPREVVAQMTALVAEVRQTWPDMPLGVNVLRNDGCAAIAVAHAAGADFVRVNVLCGARVTDQGIVQGVAHEVMRLRRALGIEWVKVLADVDVKHSSPLGGGMSIADEVADLIHRGLADALIVTGSGTGKATGMEQLQAVREAAADEVDVLVGSGVTAESIADYRGKTDGYIVGTGVKVEGKAEHAVDSGRVRELIKARG
ncbi:MAG: BtpA/SgcQ family protein [Phycisphaeraceae bacterium]